MNTVYVAGHAGMVGSAIVRELLATGVAEKDILTKDKSQLDLCDQDAVHSFFAENNISQVYMAAAKVGGIFANSHYPADFIYQNLMIETNVIHSAFQSGVKKLLFLGSSCIYPRITTQPILESSLLGGPLESTNEAYAVAKIAGIKLCESYTQQYGDSHGLDYRSVMPCNLYGEGDNYHIENAHVIPALIRRFHEAAYMHLDEVVVWGTGTPRREFLYVDDLARACVFLMNLDKSGYLKQMGSNKSHINIGAGSDISISQLSHLIADVTGYKGRIQFDVSKPDGTPSKLMDSGLVNRMGWSPQTPLLEGLKIAYSDFLKSERT
jgi:GDP-L-fucose synthase